MGKPKKYSKKQPAKQELTPEEKCYKAAAKCQSRYIFSCVGMLLYFMPGISCAALGLAMGAEKKWMIIGCILMGLSAALGFLGMMLMSKGRGKVLMSILTVLMACLVAIPIPFLGGWGLVFVPVFILLVVCITGISAIGESGQTNK